MWIEFMQTALKNTPESPFDAPEGIVKAFINPQTGLLASEESQNGVWEFFQAEQVPNKSSSVFEDFPAEYGEPNEKPIEILF
jgi:penicillin-binding protein 1A